jgi:DNA replication protein DnaC
VDKTHLAQALAHEAARQGFEVLYTTADQLLRHLHAGRADDSTDKRLAGYVAPDLLVIDDYGLKPPPSTGAVDMYDVINGRYEKGSIVLTSNRAPEEFTEVWGDALLAQAGLDRLVHRANVLLITGPSYRLKETRPASDETGREGGAGP